MLHAGDHDVTRTPVCIYRHLDSSGRAAGETMAELAPDYECGEATIWRALPGRRLADAPVCSAINQTAKTGVANTWNAFGGIGDQGCGGNIGGDDACREVLSYAGNGHQPRLGRKSSGGEHLTARADQAAERDHHAAGRGAITAGPQ